MEPFASPDQIDPKLLIFLEEACEKLCNWFAYTERSAPIPDSIHNIEIAPQLHGLSKESLLDDLQLIMDGAYRPSHPGSLAHLDPPPLTSSIVGDLISSGLNNNLLANELSPSLSNLERQICLWFSKKLGMPVEAGGVTASGGTLSNLMALVIARNQAGLQNDPEAVVIASQDAHLSFAKAISVMGLRPDSLHTISTNKEGQIEPESVLTSINELKKLGRRCFAVVATAGTTVRGAIDPLHELSQVCISQGIWLHVDGAIGGVFALSEKTSSLVKGISLANSISLNPQKLLGISKTSSLLLVANKETLKSTFGTQMPYLEPASDDDIHGGEVGLQGTRAADVLKLWLGLRQLGETGIDVLLQRAISRRTYLEKRLDKSLFNILSGPLHLIAFTPFYSHENSSSKWAFETRQTLLVNKFMLSRPYYQGNHYLKVVLGNPHTQSIHLDQLSEIINKSLAN